MHSSLVLGLALSLLSAKCPWSRQCTPSGSADWLPFGFSLSAVLCSPRTGFLLGSSSFGSKSSLVHGNSCFNGLPWPSFSWFLSNPRLLHTWSPLLNFVSAEWRLSRPARPIRVVLRLLLSLDFFYLIAQLSQFLFNLPPFIMSNFNLKAIKAHVQNSLPCFLVFGQKLVAN